MTKVQKTKNPVAVPTILIIGGSSGVGLEIAKQLIGGIPFTNGIPSVVDVHITGRKDPHEHGLEFHDLTLSADTELLGQRLDELIEKTPYIDLLVYSAGYAEDVLIEQLTDEHIDLMLAINMKAPAMLLSRILQSQRELPGFIAMSSITQTIPRLREPIYSASKAGLRMFAEAAAKNPRIHKTLLVAPAGIKTTFWRNQPQKDTTGFLDPKVVAHDTLTAYLKQPSHKYKEIRIERLPNYHIKQIHPPQP